MYENESSKGRQRKEKAMTDTEILDFCEEHNIEISFGVEKDTGNRHLRIRRGAWKYDTFIAKEQIECAKAWDSIVKETLCCMVDKLNREENARKAELEEQHDPD